MSEEQNEQILLKDIHDRLEAIGEAPDEERIRQIVSESLVSLMQDESSEFVRKMRFGVEREPKLAGSKFARWGMDAGDIEFLYDLMSARKEARIGKGPSEELEAAFSAVSEAMYIPMDKIREMDGRALDGLFPRVPLGSFHGKDRELAARGAWQETDAYKTAMRAMDTAESGYGSQLVGAGYVGELWQAARRESRVFSLLETFEMQAPTDYLPIEADLPEMLYVTEKTGPTDSEYATTKTGSQRVQVDAKKFMIYQIWSGEMDEDSFIPYVPFLRRQSLLSIGHYSDSAVLNGDTVTAATGNINLDDAAPAATKHYLAFDGIRKAGLIDNSDNASDMAAAVTLAKLSALRGLMVDSSYLMDWGHPITAADLVYISDPWTADLIALLDEVRTVDKYGTKAGVLTGEVAQVVGHPLVAAMAMGLTMADGKLSTTPASNVKGQVAAFNRRGFAVGWRRRVKVETERLPARDQTRIVYSLRMGMGRYTPTGAVGGLECAAVLFNITV